MSEPTPGEEPAAADERAADAVLYALGMRLATHPDPDVYEAVLSDMDPADRAEAEAGMQRHANWLDHPST